MKSYIPEEGGYDMEMLCNQQNKKSLCYGVIKF